MNKSRNNICDEVIIQKYVRHLSPLGRKVMTSFMNIKYEKSTNHMKPNSNPSPKPSHRHKRSTISIDFESPKILASVEVSNVENSCDTPLSYYPCQNNVTQVSSSTDLLKAACTDEVGISSKNVKNTTVYHGSSSNASKCIEYTYKEAIHNSNTSYEISDDGVPWTDMFDTEILQDIRQNEKDITRVEKDITKDKKSALNMKSVLHTVESESTLNEKGSTNTCVDNLTAQTKRKYKTRNDNVKKPKTTSSKRSNENKYFVKEKYTTTVKNWLNDINMKNCYGESSTGFQENNVIDNEMINETSNIEEQSTSIDTIAPKVKRIKKTIQAKLANKGGTMKFKRPFEDAVNLENNAKNCADDINGGNTLNTSDKTVKEKRIKTKFVAAIKSELPVKDITYDVVLINDTNFEIIQKIEVDTGTMVLMYSNGFCQLNKHYTDDECVPDGILFCFNDIFYYIKGPVNGMKSFLSRILSSTRLVSFDGKSVLVYLMGEYDLQLDSVNIVDTKIGASLISPDEPPDNFSKMQKLLACSAEYTIATSCSLQKAAWYSRLLQDCFDKLSRSLTELELWRVFDIEMRIVPILAGMEYRGITVDMAKLERMESSLLSRMRAVQAECYAAAGREFQLTSAAQVRAVLYDELKLDTRSNVRIQATVCRGEKSTSEEMLRALGPSHALPRLLLEHRRLHKAHATFVAGVAHHVRGGLLRPTWEQSAAATGRMACSGPNLQAIPRNTFSLAPPAEDGDTVGLQFRSLYAARAGHVLLSADFQHVECRVLAHAAADGRLRAALAGDDLFVELAAHWLRRPAAAVGPADRERTKRMVYASVYGAGARRLAAILGLPYERALAARASFNRTFPSLKAFGRSVVAACARSGGRVRTSSGRARTLADIGSADAAARAHAERQAVNFIVQGTAADLCKIAMARAAARLRSARPAAGARLLLQIHDELVWELPARDLARAAVIIKEAMESSGQECDMPPMLPVALYHGPTWGDMEPYNPPPLAPPHT